MKYIKTKLIKKYFDFVKGKFYFKRKTIDCRTSFKLKLIWTKYYYN